MDYLFNDYIKLYQNIEATEWVTIFEENSENNYENDIFTFCALIKASKEDLKKYLSKYDWGFQPGSFGKATFNQYGDDEIEYISGDRTGEFEYLIALRYFDKYPKIYEINPKLIWYGNLRHIGSEYRNPKTNDIEIKAMEHKVEVRLSYLKDFLAANKSCLSIVFDHRRYFKKDVINSTYTFKNYSNENSFICWGMNEIEKFMDLSAQYDYNSSIIGKVVIEPYSKPRHEDYKWFFDSKKYESFIIGIDEDGEDIEHICKEANLANHYGANPESPHFLTPTYFDIKVLDKYKTDPQNYEIQDSEIYYLREWSIPFCINDEGKIVVWLGDLGRIPYKEQQYWKAFNEPPKGKMEEKFFARQILNQWTNASRLESKLIYSLRIVNEHIFNKYNSVIFMELSEADAEIYKSFIIPTNLSVPEYQQFLMKLCKLTAESINTKLFKSIMGDKYDGSKGSIAQLDDFLKHIDLDNNGILYACIKKAYDSRNKLAGHRASMKEYNKVWGRDANFEINTITDAKSLITDMINALSELRLSKDN